MGEEKNKPHILKALDGITLTIQDGISGAFKDLVFTGTLQSTASEDEKEQKPNKEANSMLSFNEWCEEIENLRNEIDLANNKISYRTLQLLGPEPMISDRTTGRLSYSRSGRTPEEHSLISADAIMQQLYADKDNYEKELSFLMRTGKLMNTIDTDEVFE